MNIYYVYELIDPRNNQVFYVGKGKDNRMFDHVIEYKKSKQANQFTNYRKLNIIESILNDGLDVKYNKVYKNLDEKDAWQKEIELITVYGRIDIGTGILTNMTNGGGNTMSEVSRKKLSNSLKEYYKNNPITEEQKKKISDRMKLWVINNPDKQKKFTDAGSKANIGRIQSEEERQMRSKKLTGRKLSEIDKLHKSAAAKGRKFTEEHKQKLKEAKLKNPTKYWLGKQLPTEMKKQISKTVSETLRRKNG